MRCRMRSRTVRSVHLDHTVQRLGQSYQLATAPMASTVLSGRTPVILNNTAVRLDTSAQPDLLIQSGVRMEPIKIKNISLHANTVRRVSDSHVYEKSRAPTVLFLD